MDVGLSLVLLVLLSPLLLLIGILIKLDSPGSIFFIQPRVSARRRCHGGQTTWELRNFPFYKFRSMVQDADPSIHQAQVQAFVEGRVEVPAGTGATFKTPNDRRVTRVGQVLRQTSLDELPQLVNVLKGEMSLVGPRPVPTYEVAYYQARHYSRLAAVPGLTGIWQVKGRCQVPFDEMVRMDVEYIANQSLWLDIKLLWLTIPAVVSRRGAE